VVVSDEPRSKPIGFSLPTGVYRPEYGQVQALAGNSLIDRWHRRFQDEFGQEIYMMLESAFG
jgi:hypothetical protein